MNALPAYISRLSIMHNNQEVDLNVQSLNDAFFGAMMERHHVHQLPLFARPDWHTAPDKDTDTTKNDDEELTWTM